MTQEIVLKTDEVLTLPPGEGLSGGGDTLVLRYEGEATVPLETMPKVDIVKIETKRACVLVTVMTDNTTKGTLIWHSPDGRTCGIDFIPKA